MRSAEISTLGSMRIQDEVKRKKYCREAIGGKAPKRFQESPGKSRKKGAMAITSSRRFRLEKINPEEVGCQPKGRGAGLDNGGTSLACCSFTDSIKDNLLSKTSQPDQNYSTPDESRRKEPRRGRTSSHCGRESLDTTRRRKEIFHTGKKHGLAGER